MVSFQKVLLGFESYLKAYFTNESFQCSKSWDGKQQLYNSIRYSLLSGGKRFRPLLCLLTGQVFNLDPHRLYPLAASIECIHTYSLIHDDLPCMDNDDFRRGQPTNHKVFQEDIALLAGDALISEAFSLLSHSYFHHPYLALSLIQLLAKAIGPHGMVAGQALDLRAKGADFEFMNSVHALKTGALIELSVVGAARVAGCSQPQQQALANYGKLLGQAFQLADDLEDGKAAVEKGEASMLSLHSEKKVRHLLREKSDRAVKELNVFAGKASGLASLVTYNLDRVN